MSTETTIRPALDWQSGGDFEDIRYELSADGIAKITINRPEVRNAFRPQTLIEVGRALELAREDPAVGVIILTGQGDLAFCSGGDQRVRGDTGYLSNPGSDEPQVGRFHVTDLQVQMRRLPKPIVAMVAGYAIGGGHVLHLVCDLTIAADNARFGQTGPRVGSFDGGYGAGLLANLVGPKKAKEMFFPTGEMITGAEAVEWGLFNRAVPAVQLDDAVADYVARVARTPKEIIALQKQSANRIQDIKGFREAMMQAVEVDAIAHASKPVKAINAYIRENGLQAALRAFQAGEIP